MNNDTPISAATRAAANTAHAEDRRAEETRTGEAPAGAPALASCLSSSLSPGHQFSPGHQYVHTYLLQEVESDADPSWLAESINSGVLIACPRCHFLHLPAAPFPVSPLRIKQGGAPVDACDVCAALGVACDPLNWSPGWEEALRSAEADLSDERTMRAITLYRLWIESVNGADALRVAAIAERLHELKNLHGLKNMTQKG